MSLTVITGPMYSGKTEELLRRVRRAKHAKKEVLIYKPSIDRRYSEYSVVSHAGLEIPALTVPTDDLLRMLRKALNDSYKPVEFYAIDEIQFFDLGEDELRLIRFLAERWPVVISGLDMDFRGEPFQQTKDLMAVADHVLKLDAICEQCGEHATRTQRMVDGYPELEGNVIQVGGEESYEARCTGCFAKGD